mmetsp:Transcript_28235/g.65383  ORF Transcript_28235/g.65383 Transcript_28235/m.65383 type:complete len:138 (+) Transcript_28235:370-783(+)
MSPSCLVWCKMILSTGGVIVSVGSILVAIRSHDNKKVCDTCSNHETTSVVHRQMDESLVARVKSATFTLPSCKNADTLLPLRPPHLHVHNKGTHHHDESLGLVRVLVRSCYWLSLQDRSLGTCMIFAARRKDPLCTL